MRQARLAHDASTRMWAVMCKAVWTCIEQDTKTDCQAEKYPVVAHESPLSAFWDETLAFPVTAAAGLRASLGSQVSQHALHICSDDGNNQTCVNFTPNAIGCTWRSGGQAAELLQGCSVSPMST